MPERCNAPFSGQAAQIWLGTLVEVSARAGTEAARKAALAAAFAAIARVHRALSRHDPESELSRVNRGALTTIQPVSKDFRAVLRRALEIACRSVGAFDPTVGHVERDERAPEGGATWRDVELDLRGVRFARPLALDFDGIAKGYAVDCAVAALQSHGATAGRVNAGGDLRVFGPEPEPIHVRTGGPQSVVLALAMLADGAVATSAYGGQRRRRWGRWTTPLIDPRSALPRMSTRTVSVIAADCITADALTKVVALEGAAAAKTLASCGASAAILSPARGRWRCTRLPRPAAAA
ncbi:MAG TPA: FAD:protein FMN transferase [Casimicrobiaceae bacterium]|nr:FAD:protein FMN transferase [Casimicrobiaceae bacterium]